VIVGQNRFRKNVAKLFDVLGGMFLVLSGSLIIIVLLSFLRKAENWFISFCLLLFLVILGFGGIVLGSRRIFIALKEIIVSTKALGRK
jgi:hypothetical protein